MLKSALEQAKLAQDERLQAIRRLDAQARQLERTATCSSFDAYVACEHAMSLVLAGDLTSGAVARISRDQRVGITTLLIAGNLAARHSYPMIESNVGALMNATNIVIVFAFIALVIAGALYVM